jgi:hypothetical protein
MRRWIGVIAIAAAAGCASSDKEARPAAPEIAPAALAAVQLKKGDPPDACVEVGTHYEMIVWGDVEGARRKLRTFAVERGSNYVRLEMPAGGTLYRCPVVAPPQGGEPYALLPSAPPRAAGEVRLIKSDPPDRCQELGPVQEAIWFGDVESARTKLKERARAMGANYVRLELPTTGTAYRCP